MSEVLQTSSSLSNEQVHNVHCMLVQHRSHVVHSGSLKGSPRRKAHVPRTQEAEELYLPCLSFLSPLFFLLFFFDFLNTPST